MRDKKEIEREIFAARQDLEENLASLAHGVREKLEVRANVLHFLDESPLALAAGALITFGLGALIYTRVARGLR